MANKFSTRKELLDRLRGIQEEEEREDYDADPSKWRRQKEQWFADAFNFLISLPKDNHIWCDSWDLMGPLLESFYNYFKDERLDSPLKLLWKRISEEMRQCIRCTCQHHQAQVMYSSEYELNSIGPLLDVLRSLDEERVTHHLREINARVGQEEYDPARDSAEIVNVMYEVLMFPFLLDDCSLFIEFEKFIEAIDNIHEVALAGNQQFPGVYALFFFKRRVRFVGQRLAGSMGKLRRATDFEALQPLLKKFIGILETEVLPSTSVTSRPRVQVERVSVWLGIKSLLGFLEPPAFEEGILERYPVFLDIVLNHISGDSDELSHAVSCLRLLFEMLGCKLWLRSALSPGVMRNTLLGQCFHTQSEKSHKDIFDLFLPFLQSLEALEDGEHGKQRRQFLYFLLHQVPVSSNFSVLTRKKACQIALLIIHRGYKMNPPCPPFECAHMWGPSLVSSLKELSLHSSLRQPAFDLIQTIVVSDAASLVTSILDYCTPSTVDRRMFIELNDDQDDNGLPFSPAVEDKDNSSWSEFSAQSRITSSEYRGWMCIPMLWIDVLAEIDPSVLPVSFSKAVFWAQSRFSMVAPEVSSEMAVPDRTWLSSSATEISTSFEWKVPTGSEDGGDGKESKNSIKVSTMCLPLIRTFTRLTAQFIVKIGQGELRKQWTWEPRMGESLILLLLDPNHNVRQIGKCILEQVSTTRGLVSGLKFLCSCGSSLSAMISGLRHALKLVQLDSVLLNFQTLQHFLFVLRKLLEEGLSPTPDFPENSSDHLNIIKFSSQGGFLRQPVFDSSPVNVNGHSSNVNLKLREKFSYLLSEMAWPSIRNCLVEGKAFIDHRICQMTCVRLLEILPVVFEKIWVSFLKLSGDSVKVVEDVFDFKWLHDLMEWGKSSIEIITVYWKRTVTSLLNLLKGSCSDTSASTIRAIEDIISCDGVAMDELTEKVSYLSVSLSKGACNIGKTDFRSKALCSDRLSFKGEYLASKVQPFSIEDADLQILDSVKAVNKRGRNYLIVLSDDEMEQQKSPKEVTVSDTELSNHILDGKTVALGFDKSISPTDLSKKNVSGTEASKDFLEAFQQKDATAGPGLASQNQDSDTSRGKAAPASLLKSKGVDSKRKEINMKFNVNDSFSSQCKSPNESVSSNSMNQARNNAVVQEMGGTVSKELVRDNEDDPWESALKSARRQRSISVKSSTSLPERQATKHKTGDAVLKELTRDTEDVAPARRQQSISGKSSTSIPVRQVIQHKTGDTVLKELVRDTEEDPWESALRSARRQQSISRKSSTSVPERQVIQHKTGDTLLKELVHDTEDDPWESALRSARRQQSILGKTSTSVPKRQVIQLKTTVGNRAGHLPRLGAGVKRFKPPRLDDWYRPILEIDYFATVGLASAKEDENQTVSKLKEVPVCFQSAEQYVDIFRPLLLEEFKAQLHSSFLEMSSREEMCCGSLSVLSVERIDDFHLVRFVHEDNVSAVSRSFSENDIVLLTKEPLQSSSHNVHMVGKVEMRDRDNKRGVSILMIRFYLQNGSSRLNQVRRNLIDRSKWHASRIMSITPQLREIQALSSIMDIPLLPVILNPVIDPLGCNEPREIDMVKLSPPLQQILKSSFNDSQLQAISVAIGSLNLKKDFELSLIQGPPGTGKTRTLVAIVSALLASPLHRLIGTNNSLNNSLKQSNTSFTSSKQRVSQSAAIARAWQDAALARQLNENVERNSKSIESSARGRVLICAQSNAAVDELVSRLTSEGLYGSDGKMYKPYLVRVGNARTVHPNSLPFFIDTLVNHRLEERMHMSDSKNGFTVDSSLVLRSNLEKLVDGIRFYEAKRANLRDGNSDLNVFLEGETDKGDDGKEMSDAELEMKLRKLYEEKKKIYKDLSIAQAQEKRANEETKALKHKLRKSILREAEIVVATLSGCGGDLYGVCSDSVSSYKFGNPSEHTLFDAVVIDEAAQALEPATLIPLQLLKSTGTKCIMVGDPKQLPATVLSDVASKYKYQCSMFERLQRAGHPVVMLTKQYRMHPEISRFPSLHFYDRKLLDGNQMSSRAAPFHATEGLGPYVFYDISDGQELRRKSSGALSLYNEREADAAVEVLRFFKEMYPSEFVGGRIGIITPYKCQLSLLRSRFSSTFGASVTADMEFNTVDGFQGREVDVLLLSTVRAADSYSATTMINSSSIGFVADVRRMNVALTRAKLSLWILGNARTLRTNHNWAALVEDAKQRNLVISAEMPYTSLFKTACRQNSAPTNSDSYSRQPKHGEKVKDNSQHAQRNESTKTYASKTKYSGNEALGNRRIAGRERELSANREDAQSNKRRGRDESDSLVQKDLSSVVADGDNRTSKDVRSAFSGKDVTDGESKGRDTSEREHNSENTRTGKRKVIYEKSSANFDLSKREMGDNCNYVKSQVSKGVTESSERGRSRRNLAVSTPVTKGSLVGRDANDGNIALNQVGTVKDLIAKRKQQREAVDAILPSALIPSKKPDKRPLSPTSTTSGGVKPAKARKALPPSSTSALQDQIHHHHSTRHKSS